MENNIQVLFNMMLNSKRVRITKEFRKRWQEVNGYERNFGQWFWIIHISHNKQLCIQGEYHDIFENVEINELIF